MKKNRIKAGKIIKGYLTFPVFAGIILVASAVAVFILGGREAFLAALCALVVYAAAAAVFIAQNYRKFTENLLDFIEDWALMENRMIEEYPLPYAITDKDGEIILFNGRFGLLYEDRTEGLSGMFREITPADLIFEGKQKDISAAFEGRNYRIHFTKLSLEGVFKSGAVAALPANYKYVLAVHLIDETEIVAMTRAIADSAPVICNVRIDDYEEISDRAENTGKSLVTAHIDEKISSYFSKVGGLVRKTERNRYFIVFEHKALAGMQRNKFDLLDSIRAISAGDDLPVTISAGVGAGKDYNSSQRNAAAALELALGRGGDQVVLKEGERTYFYGGKSKSVEKNSRVRARVTAVALRDIILSKDHVVVMGHKTADADCFGAAVGIAAAASALGKKAYIVLNELNNSVHPILEDFLDSTDFGENVFVSASRAPQFVNDDTVLVIVDVNRPEIFECPSLTAKTHTIVMIDHHLQSGDRVDNVMLSYVEPSASSTCEMVTELLPYISGDFKLSRLEAEALYAGILIDTDSFTKNTGVKTFEAAAALRRYGVDLGRVKGLFGDSLDDYKIKAAAAQTAEMFAPGFVMAVCPPEGSSNPTVTAAQAANELLDINDVRAAFVLVRHAGKVFISARSKSDVNVQLIMERMGGGGHMNVAGTQLEGVTVEEAARKLKLTVEKMTEEGVARQSRKENT